MGDRSPIHSFRLGRMVSLATTFPAQDSAEVDFGNDSHRNMEQSSALGDQLDLEEKAHCLIHWIELKKK